MTADEPIDFAAIRKEAEAAAEEFLSQRWDNYIEMVRRVEALPENQSGADKTWVGKATEAYRQFYRSAVRVRRRQTGDS